MPDRPDPALLSERLFDRFDEARRLLTRQSDVAEALEEGVRQERPDVVVLIIADGLSYYDLPEDADAEPCLVSGASITEVGYPEVIGRPAIAARMFALGYRRQFGYTYYTPAANTVGAKILSLFSEAQIVKVSEFEQILNHVAQQGLRRTYLQIAMPGLDEICHGHHDRPPRDHYLKKILDRYASVIEVIRAKRRKCLVCLTADHGILWREALEGKEQVVQDLLQEDARSARYVRGHLMRVYGRHVTGEDGNYTLLRYPFLIRGLRSNEWGVHGGISAWESIVPLILRTK